MASVVESTHSDPPAVAKKSQQIGFAETKDFRICTLGNVDSGKSTLTGCLTRGVLDDGRGKARSFVLRHVHEQKRGQSSSVTSTLLGYNANGQQILPSSVKQIEENKIARATNKDFFEVASKAMYRVSVVDLCGHQKYLKSSIYGLCSQNPDCALIVIGSERGIKGTTREHMGLACALGIPFFVVMTKVDLAPPDILKDTQEKIKRLLKRAGRKAFLVRENNDIEQALKCMNTGSVTKVGAFVPVFEVSCVTGLNMEKLKSFVKTLALNKTKAITDDEEEQKESDPESSSKIRLDEIVDTETGEIIHLKSRNDASKNDSKIKISPIVSSGNEALNLVSSRKQKSTLFMLDDIFNPPGVGIVCGGSVSRGEINVGSKLHVGPTKNGDWFPVAVRSIYRQCVPSSSVFDGQHATLAIKSLTKQALRRDQFRRGMFAVGEHELEDAKKRTIKEFDAEVKILHHATTIEPGYSPFIHVDSIRQSARVVAIFDKDGNETVARTGSQVKIRYCFNYSFEYLRAGRPLIFREGNSKGCGRVTTVYDADGNVIDSI